MKWGICSSVPHYFLWPNVVSTITQYSFEISSVSQCNDPPWVHLISISSQCYLEHSNILMTTARSQQLIVQKNRNSTLVTSPYQYRNRHSSNLSSQSRRRNNAIYTDKNSPTSTFQKPSPLPSPSQFTAYYQTARFFAIAGPSVTVGLVVIAEDAILSCNHFGARCGYLSKHLDSGCVDFPQCGHGPGTLFLSIPPATDFTAPFALFSSLDFTSVRAVVD